MTTRERVVAALVLGSIAALYLVHLGETAFWDPDEGRYASVAAAMVRSGDWIVPRLGGAPYLEKPPLLYWCTAASFRLLGFSELAGRLPTALFALAGIGAVFLFGSRSVDRETGLAAAGILAASPGYFAMGRLLTTDMLLCCAMTLALLAFFRAAETGSRGRYLGFWAAAAAATLAKGPVGLVLTVFVAVAYAVVSRQWRVLREMRWAAGGLLVAVLVLPWFAAVEARHPEFLEFFVVKQHLERFLSPQAEHRESLLFFVPVFAVGFFPWWLFLPQAAGRDGRGEGERRLAQFLWIWAGAILVFFSLSSGKLMSYVLPALPPAALLAGRAWTAFLRGMRGRGFAASTRAGVAISASGMAATAVACRLALPRWIERQAKIPLADVAWIAAALAVVLAAGAASLLWLAWRDRRLGALVATCIVAAAVFLLVLRAAKAVEPHRSTKPIAEALGARIGPGDRIAEYRILQPSLEYYLARPPIQVGMLGELRFGASIQPDPARYIEDPAGLEPLMESAGTVWCLAERVDVPEIERLLRTPVRPVASNAYFVLFKNRPTSSVPPGG
ncbi:MAG: glycosyltransferase family 39 protein [Acidobacteriia bacterium]|nr:glycosyltransferase family 39 protein [Terriglobia bacterium]